MEYVNFVFGNYINKNDKNITCSSSSSSSSGNKMDVSILKLIYDHCMFWSNVWPSTGRYNTKVECTENLS